MSDVPIGIDIGEVLPRVERYKYGEFEVEIMDNQVTLRMGEKSNSWVNLNLKVEDGGGSGYKLSEHSLRFTRDDMSKPTFPLVVFEELAHNELGPGLHERIGEVWRTKQVPEELSDLPIRVKNLLLQESERKRSYRLVQELKAKRRAVADLMEWSGGDMGKFGLTKKKVEETMRESLVSKGWKDNELANYVLGPLL